MKEDWTSLVYVPEPEKYADEEEFHTSPLLLLFYYFN